MRTLLLAALSLSTLTPTRNADACGNYRPEPRVMRLSTHFIYDLGNTTDQRRTFVLYSEATPPAKLAWRMLAPMSYDNTRIADASKLANPVTLTLVGPNGTRVVSSTKHVYLSKSWDFEKPQNAIDVGNAEGFSIAIEGKHEQASWTALEELPYKQKAMLAWVKAQGITPYDDTSIYASRVAGTKFETVSVFPKNGNKMVTLLKQGDQNLGRFEGTAMGAFTNDGMMNLVLADGARTTQVFLTNTMLSGR